MARARRFKRREHGHGQHVPVLSSQDVLSEESTGTGTGNGIGGEGVPDKINMEEKERNWRQSFDGIDLVDGVDSSEDNSRGQGIEGDGGLNGVGRFGTHMRVFIDCVLVKRDMYSDWLIDSHMPFHIISH